MFLIPKQYYEIKKTDSKGLGVFIKRNIIKGTIVGDYVGKLVPYLEVDYEEEKKNMFLMYFNDDLGILPNLNKPGVHLINHSCSPNCFIYKYQGHTLFFALRNILKSEELTISYLLPPKKLCSPCTHTCYCQSINCTGSMHHTEYKYQRWQKFQKLKEGLGDQYNLFDDSKNLRLLKDCPKFVPVSYVKDILNLRIIG